MKKLLVLLLVLVLCVSLAPLSAFASGEPEETASGEEALLPVEETEPETVTAQEDEPTGEPEEVIEETPPAEEVAEEEPVVMDGLIVMDGETRYGTCGENLTWTLDNKGTLTISGTGEMDTFPDSQYEPYGPWYSLAKLIKAVVIESGVTSIGIGAFLDENRGYCNLTSVTIPESVTSIGVCAFKYCSSLTSVTIPGSVTRIGSYAFYGCSNLTSVTIPEGVTTIESYAFYGCSSLTSVTIPEGVTTVESSAFKECTKLAWIVLPSSVRTIGEGAFSYCILDTVYYTGSRAQLSRISIDDDNNELLNTTYVIGALYTVSYDANGGTGAPAAQTKTHDVALTLSSTTPTRTGYTFLGWATTSTATTASYTAGGSYTNNADVTLYAVWKQTPTTTAATITTANATAAPGGTVTVTVSVAKNPGMMYLSVTPVYDKTVLTLESVKNGTVFPTEPTKDTNYTWDEDVNVFGNGTLFTYTFKVKDSAAEGNYTVGVSLRECYNASEQALILTVINGTVTVNKCVYGDATGDGTVNGLDLVRLRKYLAAYDYDTKTSTVTISAGADATGDSSVNGLDLVRLRKYLAAYNYDTKTSTVVLGPKG